MATFNLQKFLEDVDKQNLFFINHGVFKATVAQNVGIGRDSRDSRCGHAIVSIFVYTLDDVIMTDVKLDMMPSQAKVKFNYKSGMVHVRLVDFNIPYKRTPGREAWQNDTELLFLDCIYQLYGGHENVEICPATNIEYRKISQGALKLLHSNLDIDQAYNDLTFAIPWPLISLAKRVAASSESAHQSAPKRNKQDTDTRAASASKVSEQGTDTGAPAVEGNKRTAEAEAGAPATAKKSKGSEEPSIATEESTAAEESKDNRELGVEDSQDFSQGQAAGIVSTNKRSKVGTVAEAQEAQEAEKATHADEVVGFADSEEAAMNKREIWKTTRVADEDGMDVVDLEGSAVPFASKLKPGTSYAPDTRPHEQQQHSAGMRSGPAGGKFPPLREMFADADQYWFRGVDMALAESAEVYATLCAGGCKTAEELVAYLDDHKELRTCTCSADRAAAAHEAHCLTRQASAWTGALRNAGVAAFTARKIVLRLECHLK